MAHVSASFAVSAGAYAEAEMDLTGLTPDEMAEEIFGMARGHELHAPARGAGLLVRRDPQGHPEHLMH